MKKSQNKKTITFYCFTPLVSLATFFIEFIFAIYVWIQHRTTLVGRLAMLFLFLLGFFQLAEYSICRIGYRVYFARAGFVAISFLPILAIHVIDLIINKRSSIKVKLGYVVASAFSLLFIFDQTAITGAYCPGYFVVFDTATLYYAPYAIFYWGYIITGLIVLLKALKSNAIDQQLGEWTIIAYLVSAIPVWIVNAVLPETVIGHASIYCGFAILTAIVLMVKVLPRYNQLLREGKI